VTGHSYGVIRRVRTTSAAAGEPMTSDNWPASWRPRYGESPESRPMTSRVLTSSRGRRCSGKTRARRPAVVSICCGDFETRSSPTNAQSIVSTRRHQWSHVVVTILFTLMPNSFGEGRVLLSWWWLAYCDRPIRPQ